MTNENTGKATRNRRTRVQVMADLEAKLARLKAQVEGTYSEDTESDTWLVKQLRRAIRRRETAMGNATTLLEGRKATEKSPAIGTIDSKIANAETRLKDMHLAKSRAIEQLALLPNDIERLRDALTLAESDDKANAEMPTGLYVLPNESERTDAEIEAGSVSN